MPQADSFTNVIVLIYAIPSFMLISFIVDETSEEDELDDCVETFMDYAFQSDRLCYVFDGATQKLFSTLSGHAAFFAIILNNTVYQYASGSLTLPTQYHLLASYTAVNSRLIEEFEMSLGDLF